MEDVGFVNPKKILEMGAVHVSEEFPAFNPEEQIQQAGIDLRIDMISQIVVPLVSARHTMAGLAPPPMPSVGFIGRTEKQLPNYIKVEPHEGRFFLDEGVYVLDFMESVKVPENCMARIIHRSTLNRCGVFITGSLFDPGFSGQAGATMYVHLPVEIEHGARLAQIYFIYGSSASIYEGDYNDLSHGDTSGAYIVGDSE